MPRSLALAVAALATLSVAHAQATDPASQEPSSTPYQSQPAPIVQAYGQPGGGVPGRRGGFHLIDTQPVAGVFVRSDVPQGVQTISEGDRNMEIRVSQGRADVTVHHPADHSELLVDLPGGQVALLKDGLYTFNAGSDTVRVLRGEAEAYPGAKNSTVKPAKVKEDQQVSFFGTGRVKAVDAYPDELTADLLPGGAEGVDHGIVYPGYGPYGDGFYGGYPYYAGFYPYGFYPWGFGYPFGVGIGFGYYGGFGGYRGGFGGFRGGGFHGR